MVVELSDGRRIGADVVVAAIGVEPVTEWVPETVERGGDGGLLVDRWV